MLLLAATITNGIQIIVLTRTEPWSGGIITFLFCYIFLPIGLAFLWGAILLHRIENKKHIRISFVLIAAPPLLILVYIFYAGAILNERDLDYLLYMEILVAYTLFASVIADLGGYSREYVKDFFKALARGIRTNKKFIDFKFITIFRLLFCALAIMAFLMPWTYSTPPDSGMGGMFIWPPQDTGITNSGYDYMVGCSPVKELNLFIQMPYLICIPILLIISAALLFFNNKKHRLCSTALMMFSPIPIIFWYLEIDSLILLPHRNYFFLTYGLAVYIILVIVNIIIDVITLKFSDIQ
ncbi:MAG: hypothetical protein R6W91_06495 [Thermoplasmata archaeon]